jgi:hypothetical protein
MNRQPRLLVTATSLADASSELSSEWHPTKNTFKPEQYLLALTTLHQLDQSLHLNGIPRKTLLPLQKFQKQVVKKYGG